MGKTLSTNSDTNSPDLYSDGQNTGSGGEPSSENPEIVGNDNEFKTADIKPEPEKRGRGRPAKSGTDAGSGAGSGNQTGNQTGNKKAKGLDVKSLSNTIEGGHQMLALLVAESNPALAQSLQISSEKASMLATAISDTASYYNMKPNPILISWINLGAVCFAVYAPQFALYNELKKGS